MRFLHTADWHIGKKLKGICRLQEQRAILQKIVDICKQEKVDVVLVAGDIYDVAIPSSEAVEVLHHTALELAKDGRLVVFISGNHDDPVRLANATIFSEKDGIYFHGNVTHKHIPLPKRAGVKVLSATTHSMTVAKNDEQVYLHILPYPSETRLKEERQEEESYLQKMQRWIDIGKQTGNLPSIFLSHLFVIGGQSGEEERELGTAKLIPIELLPKCDYVALGHIHKRQKLAENMRYSGSIMQYSFDDRARQKSVTIFDLNAKNGLHNIHEVELKNSIALKRIEAYGVDGAIDLLKQYQNFYVELILYMDEPLKSGQLDMLYKAHTRLVTVQPIVQRQGESVQKQLVESGELLPSEIFKEFYQSEYGKEPEQNLVDLFIEYMEKCDET